MGLYYIQDNNDVVNFVIGIGLDQYCQNFIQNKTTGEQLANVDEKQLKTMYQILPLGHRKNLIREISNYNQKDSINIDRKEHLKKLQQQYRYIIDTGLNKQYRSLVQLKEKKKSLDLKNSIEEHKYPRQDSPIVEKIQEKSISSFILSNLVSYDNSPLQKQILEKYSNESQDISAAINTLDIENIFKSIKLFSIKQPLKIHSMDIPERNITENNYNDNEIKFKNKIKLKKKCRKKNSNFQLQNKNKSSDRIESFRDYLKREFGKYLIDYNEIQKYEKIGEGGFGEVYLGEWLGQDIAIKKFGTTNNKKFDKKALSNFAKEIQLNSNLRHPNILLYMGVCFTDDEYFMITEQFDKFRYLDQGSLFDHIHQKKTQFTDKQIINICEDIALGMVYLHDRKVLHCDLKSSNILLDDSFNIKICDFGLSQVKSQIKNKNNQGLIGTPNWMAPEIMRGESYDEFSDVYSYGIILWEVFNRQIPWGNENLMNLIEKVGFQQQKLKLRKVNDSPFALMIDQATSFDRKDRPTFKQILETIKDTQDQLDYQSAKKQSLNQ